MKINNVKYRYLFKGFHLEMNGKRYGLACCAETRSAKRSFVDMEYGKLSEEGYGSLFLKLTASEVASLTVSLEEARE